MSLEPRWFAAYVRSRHEDRVALHFRDRCIESFLPQYKSERKWSDRRVALLLPLFPGYIFVRIEREERGLVLETPGVLWLVGASGSPEAIEDAEIERLRLGTQKGRNPQPHPYVRVGDRVRVTRGPLQGTEGFLLREKNKSRVVLALDRIQRAMSVEVDLEAIAAF